MKVYGDLDIRNGIILLDGVPVLRNEFYLTVKQSDDLASFGGISLIGFDAEFFYVSQNFPNTDEVQISFRPTAESGEANTASNLGSGEGVFFQKTGVDLEFKSLVAGDGIELSSDNDEITLTAPEKFYLTVKQINDLASFGGISLISFGDGFYVSQNFPNTDEAIINLDQIKGDKGDQGDPGPGANCSIWRFSTTTTDADPGNGRFRLNNATQGNATQIYIDNQNNAGSDFSTFLLALLKKDNTLYIQQENDATKFHSYSIDADAVDAGGYVRIPAITNINSGDDIANNQTAFICVAVSGPAGEGFYLTVKQTNGLASFGGISVINFGEGFYVTQNFPNTDESIINFRGDPNAEANTASNLGSGEGVFGSKVGVDLRFKSLVAGAGVELSSDADEITINAPEKFYLTVKQTDDAQVIRDVNVISFNADDFYVTSNPTNPDESVINLRDAPVNVVFSQDFASSLEWIVNHNLNTTDLVWSAYDDAQRALVPSVVDTSNPNTSFFYFAESVAGRAVLVGAGGKVNTLLTDDISVIIETPTIKSYNLNRRASFDYQIQQVTHGLEFGGATGGFYINGVSVAGLDPVFFYATEATEIATGANIVREGDRLSLSFFESISPTDLSFSMKIVRI